MSIKDEILRSLNLLRIEHLFVFELGKYISIKSLVVYLISYGPRLAFYNEAQKASDKYISNAYEIIVEEIDFDTLIDDNPDEILYCGENGSNILYSSVADMKEDLLIMKLSDVYL